MGFDSLPVCTVHAAENITQRQLRGGDELASSTVLCLVDPAAIQRGQGTACCREAAVAIHSLGLLLALGLLLLLGFGVKPFVRSRCSCAVLRVQRRGTDTVVAIVPCGAVALVCG